MESREGAETSILEEFGRGPREPEKCESALFPSDCQWTTHTVHLSLHTQLPRGGTARA